MSIKKNLLIILVASTVLLLVAGRHTQAQLSKSGTVAAIDSPHLGEEIIISALDNEQNLHYCQSA